MSSVAPTPSPGRDALGRWLTALQAVGADPVVNPRRGKLAPVVPRPESLGRTLAWGVAAFAIFWLAAFCALRFAGNAAGFIYAGF